MHSDSGVHVQLQYSEAPEQGWPAVHATTADRRQHGEEMWHACHYIILYFCLAYNNATSARARRRLHVLCYALQGNAMLLELAS